MHSRRQLARKAACGEAIRAYGSHSLSTASCGLDLHLYAGRIPAMKAGDILGHELVSEVVADGKSRSPRIR